MDRENALVLPIKNINWHSIINAYVHSCIQNILSSNYQLPVQLFFSVPIPYDIVSWISIWCLRGPIIKHVHGVCISVKVIDLVLTEKKKNVISSHLLLIHLSVVSVCYFPTFCMHGMIPLLLWLNVKCAAFDMWFNMWWKYEMPSIHLQHIRVMFWILPFDTDGFEWTTLTETVNFFLSFEN